MVSVYIALLTLAGLQLLRQQNTAELTDGCVTAIVGTLALEP